MLDICIRGDVCGLREVGRADDGVLPKSSEVGAGPVLLERSGSILLPDESLLVIAAGAVGGETSSGCFAALAAGPAGGFAIREARSDLPGGSGASSRLSRRSDGGGCGANRSAFGPVGGCTVI